MLDKAEALAQAGRFQDADAIYQKLLSAKRVRPEVLRAVILFHNRHTHQFRRALQSVAALLNARPKSATTHALAAETYTNVGRLPVAQEHVERAVALDRDDPDVRFAAAFTALQRNDFALALSHIDHALLIAPDHRPSQLQKGWALLGLGQAGSAAALCRELFADSPDDINLLGLYTDAARITADDPLFLHMQDVLLPRYETVGGKNLSHLLKLLGKAHNDFGDHDGAFRCFERAKAAAPMAYDAKGYMTFVHQVTRSISRADYFGKGADSDQPVLIVGMPRSGSTLVEQILASHPQVTSIGESPNLHRIVQEVGVRRHNGADMVRAIKQMPAKAARQLAQTYLDEMGRSNATRVIDKSLHNFELLGFFAALLPKARIIHVTRDPMDTCLSCYMQNLSAWHKYTQSLETLGHAYVQYRQLMDHWKTALPNPTLNVSYEAVVDDIEAQARRAVAFLGLDWDPACLDFHKQGQQSRTLSARQVRQPLYTTSMQRWRRYEKHLDPLKRALARFYPNGFDAPVIQAGKTS